jgi:adenosylcobinamide kinase / adenosylcobinamide-phosphate guanylyltransferase
MPAAGPPPALPDPAALPRTLLVLGGARSGKSRYAEGLIEAAGGGTYVATAEAGDGEMAARIRVHRARRGAGWTTVEAPLALVEALHEADAAGRPILVDCLTLWLSNLMLAERDAAAEVECLAAALPRIASPVVLVANEVGLGIVPDNALARRFRDLAGHANQRLAAMAERVVFVAAGLPLVLR